MGLRWANRVLGWANRVLWWANRVLWWANRVLGLANRVLWWAKKSNVGKNPNLFRASSVISRFVRGYFFSTLKNVG